MRPKSTPFRTTLITVIAWQLVCLAMMYVYDQLLAHVVGAAYRHVYGDLQASYGRYERLSTYLRFFAMTLPACVVSMLIVDKLVGVTATARRRLFTIAWWELLVMFMLVSSYEIGLPHIIRQFAWRIFGPPAEIYGFQNAMLPRLIAWLLCTLPPGWLAVWSYTGTRDRNRE